MNILLALQIIELALRIAPGLVKEFQVLFAQGEPTEADWDALRTRVLKSYDDYINEAKNNPTA